ncbi:MAG: glycosyltransferase family 4 protein [Anaerolineae bacterium]|nr:glycosyltransferase family 4 protein [Anaerolineae bacterium]
MRIVFLLTQDLTSPGGLGRYAPLAKELVRAGHKVMILALHSHYAGLEPKMRAFTQDGARVRYVGQMHVRKLGSQKLYFGPARLFWVVLCATWQLFWNALNEPADIYYVGKPHPMNGVAGLLASRIHRKALYVDCDDYEAGINRFAGKWQKAVIVFFETRLPQHAAWVTFITDFMYKYLAQTAHVPAERLIRLNNGVDRDRFTVMTSAVAELRQSLKLNDKKIILYLGSMSLASHAVDLLLEAFALIVQKDSRAFLLLVGGGEDYETLQTQAIQLGLTDQVLFVGRVSPDTVPLYYQLANVTVDPVRDDPGSAARFPLKIVESLVAGVPVVTGDSGNRRQLLGNGAAGVLIKPDDRDELAAGILQVLQSSTLAAQLSEQARSMGEAYYWDTLVQTLVQHRAFTVRNSDAD